MASVNIGKIAGVVCTTWVVSRAHTATNRA